MFQPEETCLKICEIFLSHNTSSTTYVCQNVTPKRKRNPLNLKLIIALDILRKQSLIVDTFDERLRRRERKKFTRALPALNYEFTRCAGLKVERPIKRRRYAVIEEVRGFRGDSQDPRCLIIVLGGPRTRVAGFLNTAVHKRDILILYPQFPDP